MDVLSTWCDERLANFSRDLHLGRREDRRVVSSRGERGQVDGAHPPAVMFQGSSERWLAVNVADQSYGSGVEIAGNLDLLFLGRADDWFDGQVILQRLLAASVDVSNRRADLSVRVGVNIL